MNEFYLILGIALVLLGIIDALWTTLWVDGSSGPLSSTLTTGIWWVTRNTFGQKNHRLMSLNGPLTLIGIVVTWVVILAAGWTLVLGGTPDSLEHTHHAGLITWTDRIFFVFYAMFTMGNGDFVPRQGIWQLVAAMMTATGMITVTLAISYILSVLSAVVHRRSFASQISALGASGEQIVENAWTGEDFGKLDSVLRDLSSQLATLTEQNMAYPILYYYHSENPSRASAIAIAHLHEALLILSYAVAPEHRPDQISLRLARETVGSHLDALHTAFIEPAEQTPARPNLERLRELNIALVRDDEFDDALRQERSRRKKLQALIVKARWRDEKVHAG